MKKILVLTSSFIWIAIIFTSCARSAVVVNNSNANTLDANKENIADAQKQDSEARPNTTGFLGLKSLSYQGEGIYKLEWIAPLKPIEQEGEYAVYSRTEKTYNFDEPLIQLDSSKLTYTTESILPKGDICFLVRVINSQILNDMNMVEKCLIL